MALNTLCVYLGAGVTQDWRPSQGEQPSHHQNLHFIDPGHFALASWAHCEE